MSLMTKREKQIVHLLCPVCYVLREDVKYYKCPKDHSICGKCLPNMKGKCPLCKEGYEEPKPRDFSLEEKVAQAFRDDGFECPHSNCDMKTVPGNLLFHMITLHRGTNQARFRFHTNFLFHIHEMRRPLFQPGSFSYDGNWSLSVLSTPKHTFCVCLRASYKRNAALVYVVMDAPKEVAECYQVAISIKKYLKSYLFWTGRVFSVSEDKKSIWESSECLAIPEATVDAAKVPAMNRPGGYTCAIDVRISKKASPVKSSRISTRSNPFRALLKSFGKK